MNTVKDATILITGAGRGIGKSYAEEFLKAGAKKIYLGVRNLDQVKDFVATDPEKLIPIKMDVTNSEDLANAAKIADDIDILVNNAGILFLDTLETPDLLENARKTMEVNYVAPLALNQIFAPILKKNGGGVIIIISSLVGHLVFPDMHTYAASKFAAHSLILSTRIELAPQGTKVIGIYPGPIDTEMTKDIPFDTEPTEVVPLKTIEAIESGETYVFPDQMAKDMYSKYRNDPKALEAEIIAEYLDIKKQTSLVQQIHWVLQTSVKDGKIEAFKSVMADMVAATKSEDGTLVYEWFLDEANMTCHISERFENSDAVLAHLGGFGAFAERLMDAIDITGLTVYGNPDASVRDAIKDLNPVYFPLADGFART